MHNCYLARLWLAQLIKPLLWQCCQVGQIAWEQQSDGPIVRLERLNAWQQASINQTGKRISALTLTWYAFNGRFASRRNGIGPVVAERRTGLFAWKIAVWQLSSEVWQSAYTSRKPGQEPKGRQHFALFFIFMRQAAECRFIRVTCWAALHCLFPNKAPKWTRKMLMSEAPFRTIELFDWVLGVERFGIKRGGGGSTLIHEQWVLNKFRNKRVDGWGGKMTWGWKDISLYPTFLTH